MKQTNQVDLPLVFFSLAFFIVLFGLFSKLTFQKKTTTVDTTPVPTVMSKKALPVVDYDKPIMCNYSDKESSISAVIDNISISAVISKKLALQRYVVEGDCIYTWIEGQVSGKKQCEVGQYITMGKKLLSSGFATREIVETMVQQMGKNNPVDVMLLLESCKNIKKAEKAVFILPKNVVFK